MDPVELRLGSSRPARPPVHAPRSTARDSAEGRLLGTRPGQRGAAFSAPAHSEGGAVVNVPTLHTKPVRFSEVTNMVRGPVTATEGLTPSLP